MTAEEKKVLDAIKKAKEPVKSGDVAAKIGLDSKEVGKIISKLQKDGVVVSPKRCFYTVA